MTHEHTGTRVHTHANECTHGIHTYRLTRRDRRSRTFPYITERSQTFLHVTVACPAYSALRHLRIVTPLTPCRPTPVTAFFDFTVFFLDLFNLEEIVMEYKREEANSSKKDTRN